MLELVANPSWLFTDLSIAGRFQAAKAASFRGVERLSLWQHPLGHLRATQRGTSLPTVLVNTPAGNQAQGERGLATLPSRDQEFHHSLNVTRGYATAPGYRQVHVISGLHCNDLTLHIQRDLLTNRLRTACDVMTDMETDILIEPLNSQDTPSYFVDSFPLAESTIYEVGKKNIGLQFNIYHCQKAHGNVAKNIERYFTFVKHFRIASVPCRYEPGTGELNEA